MAVPIKPRRTSTAGKVPTTSDLADGELGVNATDKKLYIRVGAAIIELFKSLVVADVAGLQAALDKLLPRTNGLNAATGFWSRSSGAYGYNGNVTGTLVIKTTIPSTNSAMVRASIRGYTYSASQGAWSIDLGGYFYASGPTILNHSFQMHGPCPSNSVQHAISPDGYKCILIGVDATVWSYPKVEVDAMSSYQGDASFAEGWTVSIVADTSLYTSKVAFLQTQPIPAALITSGTLNVARSWALTGDVTSAAGSAATAIKASVALTGTPTAPTAAVGTNTTQLATTAFVQAEIAADAPTKTGGGASGTWGISITGSAATLATPRTLTIGASGKTFNGSANVAWTLAEIGAQANLGYEPVQQGGGAGQSWNKLYIGWLGSNLGLQVDTTNFGANWPINVTGTAAGSVTNGGGVATITKLTAAAYAALGTKDASTLYVIVG